MCMVRRMRIELYSPTAGYVEGVLGVMSRVVFVLCYVRRRRCIRGWCVLV